MLVRPRTCAGTDFCFEFWNRSPICRLETFLSPLQSNWQVPKEATKTRKFNLGNSTTSCFNLLSNFKPTQMPPLVWYTTTNTGQYYIHLIWENFVLFRSTTLNMTCLFEVYFSVWLREEFETPNWHSSTWREKKSNTISFSFYPAWSSHFVYGEGSFISCYGKWMHNSRLTDRVKQM